MTDQEIVTQLTPVIHDAVWAGVGLGVALTLVALVLLSSLRSPWLFFCRFLRLRRHSRRMQRISRRRFL